MNFYSFKEIDDAACCIRFVRDVLCYDIRDNRCQARWRGGDGYNVALTEHGWYDHKEKVGGGVIDLCAIVKFNGRDGMAKQQAQEFLGEWLGLSLKNKTVKRMYDYTTSSRYRKLVEEGYSEQQKYVYRNEDGSDAHYVIRMEHPTKKKEFIQCSPYSGSTKDVDTKLYNLPMISESSWAIVVEGEKDADTIIGWGFPATTCSCGADHWKDSYTSALEGKDVIICRDNDEAGKDHAHLVLRSLAGKAKSLRLICPSNRNKGDVTDWVNEEHGNSEKFQTMIRNAPVISPEEAMWSDEEASVYRAKKANEEPFANYTVDTVMRGDKERTMYVPRTVLEMIKDIHTRFLGFPRKIGRDTLFDHDRRTDKIEFIQNKSSLFAWIGEKSKQAVVWKTGPEFLTKDEFYQAVLRNSMEYEKVSDVPNYPMRSDVYYTFKDAMKPTNGHCALKRFMSFFCPDDFVAEILMRTMVAAMMYYKNGVQRPSWIIDSRNGQSAGKTTYCEMLCHLYRCTPIKTNTNELDRDAKELNKRLVSVTGRNSRMLLVDNVRGVFDYPYFADLVTGFSISGRSPYGLGEESRPNDLTYAITSNSANIGSDMASRSFIIYIKKPSRRSNSWKTDVMSYVEEHRYEILGDIYDILSRGDSPGDWFQATTRVPEFESEVLYKMAGSRDAYERVMSAIAENRDDANVDAERAAQAVEIICARVRKILTEHNEYASAPDPDDNVVFIRTAVVNLWLKKMLHIDIQDVRNFANTGMISCIDRNVRRYPRDTHDSLCASGILFIGSRMTATYGCPVVVPIIGMLKEDTATIVGCVKDFKLAEYLSQNGRRTIPTVPSFSEQPSEKIPFDPQTAIEIGV